MHAEKAEAFARDASATTTRKNDDRDADAQEAAKTTVQPECQLCQLWFFLSYFLGINSVSRHTENVHEPNRA
jgi:hypothetical protein